MLREVRKVKAYKIACVVGARPNFIKIAPIIKAMRNYDRLDPVLIHTGQHYDREMSEVFFKDLELPPPDIYLGVGSGTQAEQTGRIMIEVEKALTGARHDLLLLVGDVNSTLAAAIVGAKLHIPIAHVEAGLRSGDREMPEEINRIITDSLSSCLFTTCREAEANLLAEGAAKENIYFTGNVMIDTLLGLREKAERIHAYEKYGVRPGTYAVATLHRPSNVDHPDALNRILRAFSLIAKSIRIIFPVHPRTEAGIRTYGLTSLLKNSGILPAQPMGYLEFLSLVLGSKFILTDSGGIQEETTVLGIPCLTLRESTERPVTVKQGTNTLVGNDTAKITAQADNILNGRYKKGAIPELWDGRAAERIAEVLRRKL
jgi:UDP-N-acetylglucosamine 2-epimerase (non-hydrolysing)